MKMRVFRVLGLSAFFVLAGSQLAQASKWLHVRVTSSSESEKVSINVPLSVVGALAPLVEGKQDEHVRLGKDIRVEDLRRLWEALKQSPEADFVTVETDRAKVAVAIRGEHLVVRSQEGGKTQVNARIPVPVVDALLSGAGERLNISAALEALQTSGVGELVSVQDEDASVRVWIDEGR